MTRSETSTLDDPMVVTGSTYEEPNPLAEAGQQAGESVGHLAERAADIGLQQADRGKEQAAMGISHVADSIRRVSMDMQGEQPQIASVAETAADQAERIATYLQQTDAREIISKVEDVARRQPLIFLGGAFLLGVAASRFIKAAGGSSSDQLSKGYGSGMTGDYRSSTGSWQATGPGGRNGLDELPSEGI
jgi:hypothetical protein